jgi:hypothetical protein
MSRLNLNFKNWNLSVDKQTTLETYERVETPGADSCGCDNCLNFAAQRANIYPEEIKRLFTELGINWLKETEVSHIAKISVGQHCYSGWFHFKGSFEGPNCEVPVGTDGKGYTLDLAPITDNFRIGFRYGKTLTAFTETNELVQIEFVCTAPWVLTDKPEPD